MADYSDYKECTDCAHYKLCLYQEKFLIEHNRKDLIRRYGFGLCEPENCCHFQDRSRFVELPCKIGDFVYFIKARRVMADVVSKFTIDRRGVMLQRANGYNLGYTDQLGKKIFLTLEETEQALKEREKDE